MMNGSLRLLTTGLISLSLFSQSLTACINTSYSRADEVEITDELLPLILGAFPHHGNAFYEQELIRTRKILDKNPDDFDARNDLGAAHTKLEQWDPAQAEFEENEKLHPGRYETASNLGVMYKKKGDYEQAEKFISKALEIKLGGHMGLGDYYLKMIQWLGGAEELRENKNFLGVRYDEGPKATAQVANEEYIVTLIKNDYQFIDAYTVLGDILFSRGDYQLALRAYHRAIDLAQQTPAFSPAHLQPLSLASLYNTRIPRGRIRKISKIWQAQKTPGYVIEHGNGYEQIFQEFQNADRWLSEFQEIEAEYIAGNKSATFHALLAELNARGIREPIALEAGFYKGTETNKYAGLNWALTIFTLIIFLIPVTAVCLGIYLFIRFLLRRRRARQQIA